VAQKHTARREASKGEMVGQEPTSGVVTYRLAKPRPEQGPIGGESLRGPVLARRRMSPGLAA